MVSLEETLKTAPPTMFKQFKAFLTTTNALALAIGVIIGAATGKLVTAIVEDILMPIVSLFLPSGNWRDSRIIIRTTVDAAGKITETAIRYGDIAGALIDFLIISVVVFFITKALLPKKLEVKQEAATKACPECLETIPAAAHRCKFCTSVVG